MARKSVAKILDEAATILETKGFTTAMCWDPDSGGYCALGAIARAAYPKATDDAIDDIAYVTTRPERSFEEPYALHGLKFNDRYAKALEVVTATISRRKKPPAVGKGYVIYRYNDKNELRPKLVVNMLRRAAQKARDLGLDS